MTAAAWRRRAVEHSKAALSQGFFRSLAGAASLHPRAKPAAHGVDVLRDIAYQPNLGVDGLLDIYLPSSRPGPWPVVFYIHGGGFRMLSKDTHWIMGLNFARHGYMVVSINYRLAPNNPFPAAVQDTCAAWRWFSEHVEQYGGDPTRVAVAGESAGGNLAAALITIMAQRRAEPWARETYDRGIVPRACLPFCGLLQVTDPGRVARRRPLSTLVNGTLHDTSAWYLDGADKSVSTDLADPLLVIERGGPFARPLPPFFAPVGTRDPLLDDTRRLQKALDALGVPCEARYYPGAIHAFHAFVWQSNAKRCWRDAYAFLDRSLR